MRKFIGPPIMDCFRIVYNLREELIPDAVDIYKKRYFEQGQYQAIIYDGMPEVLECLSSRGYLLAVGTLKNESTARHMMEHFGLSGFFSTIRGALDIIGCERTKAEILRLVMQDVGMKPDETVLVGDTLHDHNGAIEANVGFVPVIYGFGFNAHSDVSPKISQPRELLSLFH